MCILRVIILVNVVNLLFCFVSSSDQINRHTDGVINSGKAYSFTYKVADEENSPESTTVIQSSLADDASNMNEGDTNINFRISLDEALGDSKPALDETQNSRQPLEESQVEFRSRLDNKQWIHGLSLRQQRLKLFKPYENEPQEPVDAGEEYIKMQDQLVLNEGLQRLKLIRMQYTTQTSRMPVDNLDNNPHKFENMLNFSNPFQAQLQNPTLLKKKILEEELARLNERLEQEELLKQQQQLRNLPPEQQQSQPNVLEQQQPKQLLPEEQLSQQKLLDQQPVEQQLPEKQQLPDERLPGEKPAEQQLPEKQQLPDERLPGQQLSEQQLPEKQQLPDERLPSQQLAEQQLLEKQQLPDERLPGQQLAEQQLPEKQQLPDEQLPNQQLTDQPLAEQQLSDQPLAEQQLSDQEVAEQQLSDEEVADQHLSDQEVAEQQLSDQEVAEQQLSDQEVAEQQLSDQEVAEQQLSDQEVAEQQLSDQEVAEQELSDQEEAEKQLSDQEESEQQLAKQQQSQEQLKTLKKKKITTTISHTHIMRQRHTKKHSKRHSKHLENEETTTKKHKSKPVLRMTAGFDSDDHTKTKRKRPKSHKTTKSHKRKRNKKKHYKSDSSDSDKVVEQKKSKKKKGTHKGRHGVLKYKSDQKPVKQISSEVAGDFEEQQESFETVTELQSIKLEKQMESLSLEAAIELDSLEAAIDSEDSEVATEPQSLEVPIPQSGALEVVNEPKSLEIDAGHDLLALSKVTEPDLVVQPKLLEIPLVSQVPIVQQDTTKTLQTMTIASMATMPSLQQIMNETITMGNVLRLHTSVPKMTKTRKVDKIKSIRKETNLADKLSFREIFFKPNSIGRNVQINTFATHILSSSMKIFDIMKEKTFEPTIRKRIDWVAASYDAKYRSFLKDLLKHPIKTRLGTQKVILNSIDESDRTLKRLLNYVVADLDEKGSLRQNLNLAQSLLDEVGQEKRSQLTHACKKFGICKSESGYSHFLEDVSNVLLKVDAERFQIVVDAFTETTKYVHFGNIFQPKTCLLISRTVTYVEREDVDIIRTKFKIIKNIIANRNKPLIVTKNEARYCRLNSTVALLEILNILEEKVPRTDDNIVDWGDITLGFKDWSDYNKPDILEVMGNFIQYLKDTLVRMPPSVQKRIEKYFNRIILTIN